MYSEVRAEAITEFAERLKSEMYTVGFDIDNLVKEMTEVSVTDTNVGSK